MIELSREAKEAVTLLRKLEDGAREGLPQELFLLVSALVPMPNVDLLVVNERNQLLLSRRRDPYYQNSWHIPGGCLRFEEELLDRVHATAIRELGFDVQVQEPPLAVRNVIRGANPRQEFPNERGHNVAILYQCTLPREYTIDNGDKTEADDGYLKWFDTLPPDFMEIQHVYDDVLKPWR